METNCISCGKETQNEKFCSHSCAMKGRWGNLPLHERFLKYVQLVESGCWIWAGSLDKKGYGQLNVDGTPRRAHRISFELHKGEIPAGMFVCHHCDNRACVNPDCLFLGNQSDNMKDAKQKGRVRFGERHGNAKLTESDVLTIKRLAKQGIVSQLDIARRFGVPQGHISAIKNGKRWGHLNGSN